MCSFCRPVSGPEPVVAKEAAYGLGWWTLLAFFEGSVVAGMFMLGIIAGFVAGAILGICS
jgi:hypothetical protein